MTPLPPRVASLIEFRLGNVPRHASARKRDADWKERDDVGCLRT
jgi:hypothetical protein